MTSSIIHLIHLDFNGSNVVFTVNTPHHCYEQKYIAKHRLTKQLSASHDIPYEKINIFDQEFVEEALQDIIDQTKQVLVQSIIKVPSIMYLKQKIRKQIKLKAKKSKKLKWNLNDFSIFKEFLSTGENNLLSINELHYKIKKQLGLPLISRTTLYYYLTKSNHLNYTFKKAKTTFNIQTSDSKERNDHYSFIVNFIKQNSYNDTEIFYIDEVGFGQSQKQMGYSLKGTVIRSKICPNTPNITALFCISRNGVKAIQFIEGAVTGDIFFNYLLEIYLNLELYNQKHVFLIDNCKVHHKKIHYSAVSSYINITYLPPHSPFLTCIENFFGILKKRVNKNKYDNNTDILHIITNTAFSMEKDLFQKIECRMFKNYLTVLNFPYTYKERITN